MSREIIICSNAAQFSGQLGRKSRVDFSAKAGNSISFWYQDKILQAVRSKGKYLFSIKAMSKVFQAKYVQNLKGKLAHLDKPLISSLFKKAF